MPPAVVTVTSTTPVPDGATATISPGVSRMTLAGLEPKSTAVAPPKFLPRMITVVPPLAAPPQGAPP